MIARTVRWTLASLLLVPLLAATPSQAQPPRIHSPNGPYINLGLSTFEMSGEGELATSWNPNTIFDVKRRNAYGLVKDNFNASGTQLGFAWDSEQLFGGRLALGYRVSSRLNVELGAFFALQKRSELYGLPDPDATTSYIDRQETRYNHSTYRLRLDLVPFTPLPHWFFSAGAEYTRFRSKLRFEILEYDPASGDYLPGPVLTPEHKGSALGLNVGTGLQFPNPGERATEWHLGLYYTWMPYEDQLFDWPAEIAIGGITLEAGLRFYLTSRGEDDPGRYRR